jgi:transposase
MLIIGCDFHTRYQQIAMMEEATGELTERRLDHESGEAQAFYRKLQGPVRVGIEATGPIHRFQRLLAELGHELWIGDSAKIRASEVRKQKTDERDAMLILDLLLAKRFPKIWVPTPAERDLRQLLRHRHKLVCMRTMLGNQLAGGKPVRVLSVDNHFRLNGTTPVRHHWMKILTFGVPDPLI